MTQRATLKAAIKPEPLSLASVCICPRCENSLTFKQERLCCTSCNTSFRSLRGIPWLFEQGEQLFWDWKLEMERLFSKLSEEITQIEIELSDPDLLEPTQIRLKRIKEAKTHDITFFKEIFKPFHSPSVSPKPWEKTPQTRIPFGTSIGSYTANLFRDWGWGTEENQLSFEIVRDAIGTLPTEAQILVLGAGSCRLTYDLHEHFCPSLTVAIDHHPLHLLSAAAILSGNTLYHYEFPLAPCALNHSAILRELKCPEPVRNGLVLLFADATYPPFQKKSFDLVITPWFLDVIPERLDLMLKRINKVLKPKGRWIHFGPLAFQSRLFQRCFGIEEFLALSEQSGFQTLSHRSVEIPYLKCPESNHFRMEKVQVISSQKTGEAKSAKKAAGLSLWLSDLSLPVPPLPEFKQAFSSSQITFAVTGLIDGKRSINDIVQIIVSQSHSSEDLARTAVLNLLTFLKGSHG